MTAVTPGETTGFDRIVVTCPATRKPVGSVPVARRADVGAVAARLRSAQPGWQGMGVDARARWLSIWRDWILDHGDELLGLVQQESGKSWGDANIEILATDVANYWIEHAAEFLADEHVRPSGPANIAKRLTVVYQPYQLVGVITPWNYPLAMPLLDIAPALMAGCAVVSKPSELTPLAWRAAVGGWKEIGAPDVLDVVFGAGETGSAVTDVVDYVMFTGSVHTGRRVAVAAAQRLIPCSLELGGKDAMVVCADADIDRAVDCAAWAGFFNAGQTCVSVERVYVETAVYDEFVHKLVAKASSLRQGMDARRDYSCDIGAMASEQQLAIVSRHVADAVSKGARVVTGGKARDDGLFYEPTVLVDVDHGMDCMREETFGPTLPVMKVRDAWEAIQKANDSRYGLSGSVWTRGPGQGDGVGQADEHRVGEHQQRDHVGLSVPAAHARLEGLGSGLARGRPGGHPKVLPHQRHRRRPCCDEEGAVLVSVHPLEGQDHLPHGEVGRGPRLATAARPLSHYLVTATDCA